MTKRARRLAEYLENNGWETHSRGKQCVKCEAWDYSSCDKFCRECGAKMPEVCADREQAICELEDAIAYALAT